jgi:hypothetical protein
MGFNSSSAAQASLGMQGAGVAMSTVGAYYGAKTQKIMLEGAADVAHENAKIAELAAQATLEAGQKTEQTARLRTAGLKSAQRVGFAANGVDLGSDSAVNVLTTTDVMGEIDANQIRTNAIRSAWGYRTQEVNFENEALIKRATAKSISPVAAGATSLLTGAGQVAGNWYALNKSGALDEMKANMTDDPIASMGKSRKWYTQ